MASLGEECEAKIEENSSKKKKKRRKKKKEAESASGNSEQCSSELLQEEQQLQDVEEEAGSKAKDEPKFPSNDKLKQSTESLLQSSVANKTEIIDAEQRSEASNEVIEEEKGGFREPRLPPLSMEQSTAAVATDDRASSIADSPSSKRKKKKKKKKKIPKKCGLLVSDLTSGCDEEVFRKEAVEVNDKPVETGSTSISNETRHPVEDRTLTIGNPVADLKAFTGETSLLDADSEEINILRVFKLMYGTGLATLRNLFLDIHAKWQNHPSDAAAFDKGSMKLKAHELSSFNTGDINKWDFSLLTTVLLYSKVCAQEIKKKPGYKNALHALKSHKNKLLSHPSDNKMSDADFESFWQGISKDLMLVGAEAETVNQILKDDVLQTGKYYRDLFLQERAMESAVLHTVERVERKLDNLLAAAGKPQEELGPVPSMKDLSGPKWNEWIKFCQNVRDFDHLQNQYVLITDSMSAENLKHFSSLRSVSWKMVLDLDPSSERKGMYNNFSLKGGKDRLINMITPAEIRGHLTGNLARQFDPNKTQWLFVNGRKDDSSTNGGPQEFAEWEASSVKQISRFFGCCSDPDKFDKQKPIIFLILPFSKRSLPYLEVTLNRLTENFDEFALEFVAMKHEYSDSLPRKLSIQTCGLTPALLSCGLNEKFQVSSIQEYRMPTSQDNLHAKLTQNDYLFLKEYLDVLYSGCEELPPSSGNQTDEQQLEEELNRHRESFLSGNWISFVSLFDNHDARRELGNEVKIYLQRLLDQGPRHPSIVEIRHSPGTGGTTIARRVLWDLHKSYPCAIARLEDHYYDYDDDSVFINGLADRISTLQFLCHTTPLVLLDGKHTRIEVLSNRLARVLENRGQRAILLKCQHGSKCSDAERSPDCSHVMKRFSVNVKLEESVADLNEFQAKYKEYIDEISKTSSPAPRRVFHFPLMAMLEAFRPKLQQIIYETFDHMSSLEKEIAVVVAFLQKYAGQATPAALLYEAFKKHVREGGTNKGVTYRDINQLFTEQILNLMVSANPARRWRRRAYNDQQQGDDVLESYTLQHPIVADFVLKKLYEDQKRDIFAVTRDFLKFPIFDDERFSALMNELFVRNKISDNRGKSRFSFLIEELKQSDAESAAEVFRVAAEKTNDALVFTNSARFYARKAPPSFPKAKEMIAKAFHAQNAKMKTRSIYDTKGHILYCEMNERIRTKKIKSIQQLQESADETIQSLKRARNFPPTFANPLLAEVKVWVACIEWIMKHKCDGDSDRALKYISSNAPPFFHTCIGDSFTLLDIVDQIIQSETTLQHPEDTQSQVNNLRMSLMKTFNKGEAYKEGRRDAEDVVRACQALCSSENFPKSTQSELKRLQAHYILNSTDQIETIKKEHLEYLRKLLDEIVLLERNGGMGYHLMKISVLITGPNHYTLEQGIRISEIWGNVSQYDSLPHFYQMMISLIQILDGNTLQYRSRFHKALKMCQERAENNYRSVMSTHFLGKGGQGMSRIMTKSALFRGEVYQELNLEKRKFWEVESRKKLRECSGRIRMYPKSSRGRAQPYIELVQGNIELYVGKSAVHDIGQVEKDFTTGSMVYFVVSFTLQGPVANGITFESQE